MPKVHFIEGMRYPLTDDALESPPVPCEFCVGDIVTFTNDYGISFPDRIITGFSPSVEGGRFIYYDSESWWFPVSAESLTKQTQLNVERDINHIEDGIYGEEKITKATQTIKRDDGSEVRIVAQAFYGAGLHESIDIYVLRRESRNHHWTLCSERPHPDWKSMPREDYIKFGRSPMLQAVSPGELLKVRSLIGKSMDQFEQDSNTSTPHQRG